MDIPGSLFWFRIKTSRFSGMHGTLWPLLRKFVVCSSQPSSMFCMQFWSLVLIMLLIHCLVVSVLPFVSQKDPLPGLKRGGFERVFLGFHLFFYLGIYSSFWVEASSLFDQTHVLSEGKAWFHYSNVTCSIACVSLALAGPGIDWAKGHRSWGHFPVCWFAT